jgi:hypothetical protein
MRKIVALAILGAAVLASVFLIRSKITQNSREASYRVAIAPFQRDLHMGMPRAEVQKYLDSRKVNYHAARYGGNEAETYEIKIGEEPSHSLVCEDWDVYIAFEFTAADKLKYIHVIKLDTCM